MRVCSWMSVVVIIFPLTFHKKFWKWLNVCESLGTVFLFFWQNPYLLQSSDMVFPPSVSLNAEVLHLLWTPILLAGPASEKVYFIQGNKKKSFLKALHSNFYKQSRHKIRPNLPRHSATPFTLAKEGFVSLCLEVGILKNIDFFTPLPLQIPLQMDGGGRREEAGLGPTLKQEVEATILSSGHQEREARHITNLNLRCMFCSLYETISMTGRLIANCSRLVTGGQNYFVTKCLFKSTKSLLITLTGFVVCTKTH